MAKWNEIPVHHTTQETSRHFSPWRRVRRCWIITCCDCGLTHEYRFEWRQFDKKKILMRRSRIHQAATKAERKRLTKVKR